MISPYSLLLPPPTPTPHSPLSTELERWREAGLAKAVISRSDGRLATETVGLLGTGAKDVHLHFHTAAELCTPVLVLVVLLLVLINI